MRRRWETIKLRRRSQQWNFMACKPIWMWNVRTFFSLHSVPVELTWIGSVPFATNLLIEKRIMQRHFIFKLRNALTLFLTGPMRLQRFRCECKHPFTCLGSISITTNIRIHLPSPGEDRLVLFRVATRINRNASGHNTHWICQGYRICSINRPGPGCIKPTLKCPLK